MQISFYIDYIVEAVGTSNADALGVYSLHLV